MNFKRFLRILVMLFLVGSFTLGLTSCKLPASVGPQSSSETGDGFPVPGETSGGIDISVFATQTAQAKPPIVINTPVSGESSPTNTVAVATSAPGSPEPTASEIVYVTATPGGPPATYTLESGEYLFCIARRFDVNLTELLDINELTPDSLLSPGQVIKIPQTGNPFEGDLSLHEHPDYYKIQAGDTLNSIACYYGDVSPDMIALQNHLTSTDLPVGEVLIIP
jgi:LysM repeat protein